MANDTTSARRRRSPWAILLASLLALAGVFVTVQPASADNLYVTGYQIWDTNVWWAKQYHNTYSSNKQTVSPYAGEINCGYGSMVFGSRWTINVGSASYAKTHTLTPGQSGTFYAAGNNATQFPAGIWYLTTYLGLSGGCGNTTPEWGAHIIFNTP